MSENVKPRLWRKDNPIVWGLGVTLVLAFIVFALSIQNGPNEVPRYKEFIELPSNAIGDTLAGIFAPLALIWIVVTVFLQSQELKEQRKELELTRAELKLAREAQEEQLKVMQKQANIFDDEKKRRDEVASGELFDFKLKYLVHDLLQLCGKICNVIEISGLGDQGAPSFQEECFVSIPADITSTDLVFQQISHQIGAEAFILRNQILPDRRIVAIDGFSHLGIKLISNRIASLLILEPDLSESQKFRFNELRVPQFVDAFSYLTERSDLWKWEEDNFRWWEKA